MSVTYRPDRDKWMATVHIKGKRKRLLFLKKTEAVEFDRKCRMGGVGLREDQNTNIIGDGFAEYFKDVSASKSRASKSNDRWYFNLAHHFLTTERRLEHLGEVELQDLEALQRWLQLEQNLGSETKPEWANSSVNRCFHTLKHFFGKQVAWGRLASDPSAHLKPLAERKQERRPMTAGEFTAVLGAAPEWFGQVLCFMRITAARPSSIERLNWDSIDFGRRRIVLHSKKGAQAQVKEIVLPMVDEVFQILVTERNRYPFAKGSDGVFRNEFGRPLDAGRISKVGNRLIKKVGLTGVVLYGLRHSLATDMTEAGVPTEMVRQALGHSNIRTTQGYAKGISIESVARAVELVRKTETALPPNATKEREA